MIPSTTYAETPFSSGIVSGWVWLDENENGIHEFHEEMVSEATISLVAVGDSGDDSAAEPISIDVATDATGYFIVDELPVGTYEVWCHADDMMNESEKLEVVISELNSNVTVALGVTYSFSLLEIGHVIPPVFLFQQKVYLPIVEY
ncbi:MAG: SdrD B-like domain-containing protein [Chloroflexota bacterium]